MSSSIYNEVDRCTNEGHSTTVGTLAITNIFKNIALNMQVESSCKLFISSLSDYYRTVFSLFSLFFFLLSIKTICNTKFIAHFQGQIGQKGQKGHLFSPMFFPLGARGELACKSCKEISL